MAARHSAGGATVLTLRRATDPPKLPDGLAEHPVERARRALLEAAAVESPHLAQALRRVAEALPERAPIKAVS